MGQLASMPCTAKFTSAASEDLSTISLPLNANAIDESSPSICGNSRTLCDEASSCAPNTSKPYSSDDASAAGVDQLNEVPRLRFAFSVVQSPDP